MTSEEGNIRMSESERADLAENLSLGTRLRAKRKELALTLQDVADGAGLSTGFISQIERDLTAPSLASLVSICAVLGSEISEYLSQPRAERSFTRRAERRPYWIADKSISYERISSSLEGQRLHSVIMNVPPGYRSERVRHQGEEIEFVLSGCVTSELEGQTVVLKSGDSIHHKSNKLHCIWNHTTEPAKVLWVGTLDLFGEHVFADQNQEREAE